MRALVALGLFAAVAGCAADCGDAQVQGVAWTQPGLFDAIRASDAQPIEKPSAPGLAANVSPLVATYRAPTLTDVIWIEGNVTVSANREQVRIQLPHDATNASLRAWAGDFAGALNSSLDLDALVAARETALFGVAPDGRQTAAFDMAVAPWAAAPEASALVARWAADDARSQTHPDVGHAGLGTGPWGLLLSIPTATAASGNWTVMADVLGAAEARGPEVPTLAQAETAIARTLADARLPDATFADARPEYGPIC